MRQPTLLLAALLIVNALVDAYIYRAIVARVRSAAWAKAQVYSSIVFAGLLLAGILIPFRSGEASTLVAKQWLLFGYFTVYVGKYLFVIFDLIGRIPQIFRHRRWKWAGRAGAALAVAAFCAMWWGALVNRYRMQVREVDVPMAGLPEQFSGMRIAMISDLHVGTFGADTAFVSRLVERVNELEPDVIVFGGDIVNRRSDEMGPFVEPLSRLRAPEGVVAVLGNHDYGDYYDWDNPSDKVQNMRLLRRLYGQTGIRLLLNETHWVSRGADSIALIGVENIGDAPFPVYGSLERAYPAIGDPVAKVLVSHNPAHWVDSISGNPQANIGLTLAGHTHAMQIEVAGLSPAAWRYPTWGGLYADADSTHLLYVNIGAGTVGMPMRLGATPEITILTLRKRS